LCAEAKKKLIQIDEGVAALLAKTSTCILKEATQDQQQQQCEKCLFHFGGNIT
jgi:hypothetical protein